MKINNQSQNQIQNQAQMQNQTQQVTEKNLNRLQPGERFKAMVIDIQPSRVTLKLSDGSMVTAKSKILPDARIGEVRVFEMTENAKGQILLSMVKSEAQLPIGFIKEALANAGLIATAENMDLVNALLNNGLPVDAETLQKATFFKYSEGDLSLEEILFLLKEEFAANRTNIEVLVQFKNGTAGINGMLQSITDRLFGDQEELSNELRKELLATLLGDSKPPFELEKYLSDAFDKNSKSAKDELKHMLDDKLYIHLQNKDSLKNMDSYFKEIHRSTAALQEILENNLSKTTFAKDLANVRENIEFMNNIKHYKEFMQMPFIINQTKNQGDLYVFKDGKKKTNLAEKADVLLALDYEHLGHIEIYINKSKHILNFQFKSSHDNVLQLIGKHSSRLSTMLQQEGYSMAGFSLKSLNEPFHLTEETPTPSKEKTQPKRFSFDMRV